MKRLIAVFALAGGLAVCAMAEDWTGYIVDQKCSSNKAMLGNVACATKCIKGGSAAVLATEDGKVYKIADQDKVIDHAGQKVTITGKMENDQIKVDSVKM